MSKIDDIKKSGRKKRGEISKDDINLYIDFSTNRLIEMLESPDPKNRTIAATILGNKKDQNAIKPLCSSLKKEKALYSRIAISEALGKMGEPAVAPVADLLGLIGNNQETELPQKYFNKKSYPLARDIAARTLIKIGKPATPYLINLLDGEKDVFVKQQAIDALGGITAKTKDQTALKIIIGLFDNYGDGSKTRDKLTLWKIIRALSAFKNSKEVSEVLLKVINNCQDPPLVWESARSLGQIGFKSTEIMVKLSFLKESDDEEIKKAAKNALIALENDL